MAASRRVAGRHLPLRKDFDASARHEPAPDHYPFVRVEGEGVHEIPVGPVHAGTIELGHFRFSIVGETILKLEERLGYKHKGVEKRFEALGAREGAPRRAHQRRFHGRLRLGLRHGARGRRGHRAARARRTLRGIALELERVANHLGDLGYLGNDVALSFGFFQFWRLKETLLRMHREAFGHLPYLMDLILPGGVATDLGNIERLIEVVAYIKTEVEVLRGIYDEHAGAQDRFIMAGQVLPELAAALA